MKQEEQKTEAIRMATEYLRDEATPQKVCDFLNSGKLDINK